MWQTSPPLPVAAGAPVRLAAGAQPTPAPRAARLLAILLPGCLAAGCALAPPSGDPLPGLAADRIDAACLESLQRHDQRARRAGVTDVQHARVEGFPFLRASRFLASFRGEPMDDARFAAWLRALSALDREARRHERANLAEAPPPAAGCRQRLLARVQEEGALRRRLQARVAVPDAYNDLQRLLGLYPLSKWAVLAGVKAWHEEVARRFAAPPVAQGRRRYGPAGPTPAAPDLAALARDPLGRPVLEPAQRAALFAAHAPVLAVRTEQPADSVGSPRRGAGERLRIDTAAPAAYRHLGHTRFRGRVLLQLSYVFWFPARPKTGPLDLLGGRIDGITWRVTLDEDGRVLIADSMHNCGCYHMFFPGPALRHVPVAGGGEPALVPASLPRRGPGERFVLHVSAGAHYIEQVSTAAAPAPQARYELRDYAALRSLPLPDGGHRSLFRPDGLVAGSQRLERFLLWPMGVPSAGAMRQWGRHATAFVGKRHFDDPRLIERYFEPAAAAASRAPVR